LVSASLNFSTKTTIVKIRALIIYNKFGAELLTDSL